MYNRLAWRVFEAQREIRVGVIDGFGGGNAMLPSCFSEVVG